MRRRVGKGGSGRRKRMVEHLETEIVASCSSEAARGPKPDPPQAPKETQTTPTAARLGGPSRTCTRPQRRAKMANIPS